MPMESRILYFANDEVFEALKDYSSQTDRSMPKDAEYGMVSYGNTQVQVMLKSAGRRATRSFTENELGAALIMFCIRKSIPIARRAVKTIDMKQDTVALRLEQRY